jgi:sulfur carrier protein
MTDNSDITIAVNGEARTVPAGLSINALLDHFEIKRATAIVEYNRDVLDRKLFDDTIVQDGDALEIVRFVGGG